MLMQNFGGQIRCIMGDEHVLMSLRIRAPLFPTPETIREWVQAFGAMILGSFGWTSVTYDLSLHRMPVLIPLTLSGVKNFIFITLTFDFKSLKNTDYLRSCIKHSENYIIRYPNYEKGYHISFCNKSIS